MIIAYIGDFTLHYSTERYVAYALEQLGHTVHKIEEFSIGRKDREEIIRQLKEMHPDFVLFCKVRSMHDPTGFIERLKQDFLTVTWIFDLYFDLPVDRAYQLRARSAPFNAHIVFTTDGGHDKEFEELGINHKLLRQGIHAPDAYLGDVSKSYPHPVVFVGTNTYRTRHAMLYELDKHFKADFFWYGNTPRTIVRGGALNALFASVKIVVGDSQPSPHYWSNRMYETLGRGGFLIHPRVKGLEKEFEYFKHFVPYDYGHYDQLVEIIKFYLTHDKEREAIRRAGHEYCKNNYTYTHRCAELITEVKKLL